MAAGLILLVFLGLIFVFLILVVYSLFGRELFYKPTYKFLELVPPVTNDNTQASIQLYYKVLAGLLTSRSVRFWKAKRRISLELVSEASRGIRYLAVIPEELVTNFRSITIAHMPGVKIKETADYLKDRPGIKLVDSYRLKRDFSYSLYKNAVLDKADPLAYLSGAMTKLKKDEQAALQITISAGTPRIARRRFKRLSKDIIIRQSKASLNFMTKLKYEHLINKVRQPQLRVDIRSLILSPDSGNVMKRRQLIYRALASLEGEYGQKLIRSHLPERKALAKFTKRSLGAFNLTHKLFSGEELSIIFHFPVKGINTENLNRTFSRTLPAPVSLKSNRQLDVLLGVNYHHGTTTPIGLSEAERERHVYIVGGTGSGKTTMLQYDIVQDMQSGKGLAIIDPHGDLAETLLDYVPKDRLTDVVYFNPDDLDYPIGLNLLELTPGLRGNELLREKDMITEPVVSIFRKLFSEEGSGGHRVEYVLRNAVHTALTVKDATLFTVLKLLQDAKYRKEITDKLEDEDLKDFWKNELGQAGNMQRVKMSAGVTAKIGRFNSNSAAKLILGQPKSTIDFEDIINSGKILICNFSKGLLGEDVSELFGITVLAKLQLASLRRARLQPTERRPFYLYVDEFQNFATDSFIQMLSESRKYKLFMIMAEQSTSQQKDQRTVSVILANVGTVVCFRTGNPHDENLLLPLFRPYIEAGEIANLSAFNFYARLSAIKAQEPLSGQTILLGKSASDTRSKIIVLSRQYYATPRPEEMSLKKEVLRPKVKVPGG